MFYLGVGRRNLLERRSLCLLSAFSVNCAVDLSMFRRKMTVQKSYEWSKGSRLVGPSFPRGSCLNKEIGTE